MGLRYSDQKYGQCFFVTTSFKDHQNFGDIAGFYDKLADSINFCASKFKAHIYGYAFMPSHVHLLLWIEGGKLSGFMRDVKKFIAQKVAFDLGIKSDTIWTPRYDRVAVFSRSVLQTKLDYIHNNPVKAGFVESANDWQWSSAQDYEDRGKGLINVCKDW